MNSYELLRSHRTVSISLEAIEVVKQAGWRRDQREELSNVLQKACFLNNKKLDEILFVRLQIIEENKRNQTRKKDEIEGRREQSASHSVIEGENHIYIEREDDAQDLKYKRSGKE